MATKRPTTMPIIRLMVKRGLATTTDAAIKLIKKGMVSADGIPISSPNARVNQGKKITVDEGGVKWVGRGAHKLLGAIEALDIDPTGLTCADLGASTGGFAQVLLEKGAKRVYAIDVGQAQLAWSLATDERVVVMDKCNVRNIDSLPEPIELVVADLSFISIRKILPSIQRLLTITGHALVLVKPQFEAPRDAVEKGGVVSDPELRAQAIESVVIEAKSLGFDLIDSIDSTLAGARSGNVEHFLLLQTK